VGVRRRCIFGVYIWFLFYRKGRGVGPLLRGVLKIG